MANPRDAGQGHLTIDLPRNVHDADRVTRQQMSGPDAGGLTGAAHLSGRSRVAPEGALRTCWRYMSAAKQSPCLVATDQENAYLRQKRTDNFNPDGRA